MCDYCDCRSHPQIATLSADHEAMLTLLIELERAVDAMDASRARIAVASLRELLDVHASSEERGVFVELRRTVADDAYIAMFEDDHSTIHALLEATTSRGDWQGPARDLTRALREHIFREETDLFPAAHQMLSPAQWDAVDDAVDGTAP